MSRRVLIMASWASRKASALSLLSARLAKKSDMSLAKSRSEICHKVAATARAPASWNAYRRPAMPSPSCTSPRPVSQADCTTSSVPRKFAHKDPAPTSPVFTDARDGQSARQNDIAATAFGLLPFLGAGYTDMPLPGRRRDDPEYSKTVKAGLSHLIAKQGKDGYFGSDMYSHVLATIAVCEAHGMAPRGALKAAAQKGVAFLVAAQHDEGGWRYAVKTPGDMSVTGWVLTALHCARLAGLDVPKETLKQAEKFVDSCEVAGKGAYSYLPGRDDTPAPTAIGLLCREYAGADPADPKTVAVVETLKKQPATGKFLYYEYYATQALYHVVGDAWEVWNKGPDGKGGVRDVLLAAQDRAANLDPEKACQDGSWGPEVLGPISDGGRIMATSIALLTLEVYYRNLPLYPRPKADTKDKE